MTHINECPPAPQRKLSVAPGFTGFSLNLVGEIHEFDGGGGELLITGGSAKDH